MVKKVVLITGVAQYWGSHLASQLLTQPKMKVLGADSAPPEEIIKGLDFIQADMLNSQLVELFKAERIDTIVHLAFQDRLEPGDFKNEFNVKGTERVLSAAADAGVRKIILRSSTAIYGARPTNSAFLSEDQPFHGSLQNGSVRDLVKIEEFCIDFRKRAPQLLLTILRFPNIVGPNVDSPITRYLKAPVSPVLIGFDPLMQFIHEEDAFDALLHVIIQDLPGTYNVAAEGVVPLGKVLALTGRIPLPVFHPFAYWSHSILGRKRISRLIPFEADYLRYPWVADLHQMRDKMDFHPKYSAEEALREYGGYLRIRPFLSQPAHHPLSVNRLQSARPWPGNSPGQSQSLVHERESGGEEKRDE